MGGTFGFVRGTDQGNGLGLRQDLANGVIGILKGRHAVAAALPKRR